MRRNSRLKLLGIVIFKGETDLEEAMRKDQKEINRDNERQLGVFGVM